MFVKTLKIFFNFFENIEQASLFLMIIYKETDIIVIHIDIIVIHIDIIVIHIDIIVIHKYIKTDLCKPWNAIITKHNLTNQWDQM